VVLGIALRAGVSAIGCFATARSAAATTPPSELGSSAVAPSAPAVQAPTAADRFDELTKKLVAELPKLGVTDPDMLNGVLGLAPAGSGLARFLEGIQFRFKAFESSDMDGQAALGFEYGFEKHISDPGALADGKTSWWTADFYSFGNVAFDQDVNPDDFLRTGLKFHSQGYSDDAPRLAEFQADALQKALLEAAQFTGTPEEVDASPAWKRFDSQLRQDWASKTTYQAFWDWGADIAMESNQDFSRRQYTYGLAASGILRSPNADTSISRMNFFDYPTALLRLLTGKDESFKANGAYVPGALLGIDLVDPHDDDVREAIDDDPFPRFRFELESRPVVATMGGADVYLGLDWRFYQEIDAPTAVKDADLDQASMFQASLDMPGGWSLTYAAGQLPLDQRDGSQFALGFKTSF